MGSTLDVSATIVHAAGLPLKNKYRNKNQNIRDNDDDDDDDDRKEEEDLIDLDGYPLQLFEYSESNERGSKMDDIILYEWKGQHDGEDDEYFYEKEFDMDDTTNGVPFEFSDNHLMGYSIRTKRFLYAVWNNTVSPEESTIYLEDKFLYDMKNDPLQEKNIVQTNLYNITMVKRWLRKTMLNKLPHGEEIKILDNGCP